MMKIFLPTTADLQAKLRDIDRRCAEADAAADANEIARRRAAYDDDQAALAKIDGEGERLARDRRNLDIARAETEGRLAAALEREAGEERRKQTAKVRGLLDERLKAVAAVEAAVRALAQAVTAEDVAARKVLTEVGVHARPPGQTGVALSEFDWRWTLQGFAEGLGLREPLGVKLSHTRRADSLIAAERLAHDRFLAERFAEDVDPRQPDEMQVSGARRSAVTVGAPEAAA